MNNQSGQVSRILILIAVACFVVIIVVYGVTTFISYQRSRQNEQKPPATEEPAGPEYDTQAGDIRFLFVSAHDMGSRMKAVNDYAEDLTTTERFIKVTVGAQNLGKTNTLEYTWDIGDLVDSAGRRFVSINDRAYDWLPRPDLCGSALKPQFSPVLCVKYYEVSRVSTFLKVQVKVTEPQKQEAFLDIVVK